MKSCPHCGQPVMPDAAICSHCGQPLTPQQLAQAPSPMTTTVAEGLPASNASVLPMSESDPNVRGAQSPAGPFTMPADGTYAATNQQSVMPAQSSSYTALASSPMQARRKVVLFSIVALLALVVIGGAAWALMQRSGTHAPTTNNQSTTNHASAGSVPTLLTLVTPCFSTTYYSDMKDRLGGTSGCNFNKLDASEEINVVALTDKALTTATVASRGKSTLDSMATSLKATIVSEQAAQFANSSAYVMQLKLGSNGSMVMAFVFHPTSSGDNTFLVSRTLSDGAQPSFGHLESDWKWK